MCSPFCRKNVVAGIFAMGGRVGWHPAGSHTGSIGKKEANSFGNWVLLLEGTDRNMSSDFSVSGT
jgi:hypothetical protein